MLKTYIYVQILGSHGGQDLGSNGGQDVDVDLLRSNNVQTEDGDSMFL
jgi:hypothetical protein